MREAGGSRKLPLPANVEGWAVFVGEDYRYVLGRRWAGGEGRAMFVGLNPSTAAAGVDDPTVQKCWRWARERGYGSMLMLNAFAYRATHPRDLWRAPDPVGPDNHAALRAYAAGSDLVVAAWGNGGKRVHDVVMPLLLEASPRGAVHSLGRTKLGMPRHPLYVRKDTPFTAW